jgi:RecB family exonuclease
MASVPGAPFKLADVRQSLPSIRAGGTSGEGAEFVQVTELGRLRSRRFDTVIVGGLTAAESPVCGLDSLYDELAAALGIAHGPEPEALARLHFYLAISRARRELVLIRKEETSEGAALRPSVLWEEILDAYRVPGDEPDSWPRGAPEPTRVRAEDVVEFAPVFTKGRREARAETALDPHGCASVPRGMVRDRQALEGFSAKDTYSVSEIEVYLQCPYRWFYERVVRPGEIDAALDARAVGSLAHGLLKRFYDAWNREAESLRVTPETVDLARRIFARVSASAGSEHGAQGLADDLAVARGVRWAANIIEDDARVLPGFAPAAHELSFGDEGSEFNFGGVKFRGRIDRVDVSDTALFVTDYKSSRDLVALARLESEGRIQAVVYAEATRRLMGDLPVAGSVYRSFRTHAMRGFWRPDLLGGVLNRGDEADVIDSEGYAALVEATEERVALAVEGIRAGDISRSRASRNACVFCVLAPQCEQAAT